MKRKIRLMPVCTAAAVLLPMLQLWSGIVVKGELTREKTALPGMAYEGVITLSNDGAAVVQVKVFQTDYLFTCAGETFYNDPGGHDRSNASWVEFSPTRLDVPPGGEASVSYKVTVPARESLEGTYWSMIMIEPVPEAENAPLREQTLSINTVVRYGVQLVTNIEESGTPSLNFLGVQVLEGQQGLFLQVDLENRGTRWTKPLVWVDLVTEAGKKLDRRESVPMRLYPGTSVRHRIDLAGIPFDKYKALLIADGGEQAMIGQQFNLNILQK
ncbi:hypothetical protein JXO52_00545 [bacterium]|nr:hypothetical protein [bacterium]